MAIYNAIMAFTNWMWTFPILALLIGGGLVTTWHAILSRSNILATC